MTSALITSEIQKLEVSALIELFELDLTNLLDENGVAGDIYYFHAGTNGLTANVVWQGNSYVRFPIEASGFEFSVNGQIPRPKLRAGNILSVLSTLCATYGDLIGAKLTRRRTLIKYLDAVNFAGGVNPDEDTTGEFAEDIYYVDRKATENKQVVELELASNIDLQGKKLPGRQIIQNLCAWGYRSAECGFTGGPIYDINDDLLTAATTVPGALVLSTNVTQLAAMAALATMELQLTVASNAKDIACSVVLESTHYVYSDLTLVGRYAVVRTKGSSGDVMVAYYNGSVVTIGTTYRIGSLVETHSSGYNTISTYRIQHWEVNAANCAAATTTYNTALSTRNTAIDTRDAAISAYQSAVLALPVDDPLYTRDVCGKRLTSCKNRFGANNPLPFGGFPSAGLIR